MKSKKILSNILVIAGLAVGLITAVIAFAAKDSSPAMLLQPAGAQKCAEKMLTAITDGNFREASRYMYGNPDLGAVPEDGNLAVELIWTEFLSSMEFTMRKDCYVSDNGVAVDVSLRTLDVPAVIASMEDHARELLGRRVAAAGDLSEIYDSDNNFRQEILDQILRDASLQSLANDLTYREHELKLRLVYEDGQWWVIPDSALQNVLSGSF